MDDSSDGWTYLPNRDLRLHFESSLPADYSSRQHCKDQEDPRTLLRVGEYLREIYVEALIAMFSFLKYIEANTFSPKIMRWEKEMSRNSWFGKTICFDARCLSWFYRSNTVKKATAPEFSERHWSQGSGHYEAVYSEPILVVQMSERYGRLC